LGRDGSSGTSGRFIFPNKKVSGDAPSCIDLAHEHSRAGFPNEAIEHLESASFETFYLPGQSRGAMPLVAYALGGLCQKNSPSLPILKNDDIPFLKKY
jgi:hypothetical protein